MAVGATNLHNDARLMAAKKLIQFKEASQDFLTFARAMKPDPNDPDNPDASQFQICPHHRLIAEALAKVERGECLRLAISMPPQHGKLCNNNELVPTPGGWRLHGELRPGDRVFGADGAPIEVLAISEEANATLEVEFTDGAVIKVHPRHEWTVFCRGSGAFKTLETQELMKRSLWSGGKKQRAHYQVAPPPVLDFPVRDLPIPPYTLGAWLGDGYRGLPRITHSPNDAAIICRIEADGYDVSVISQHKDTGVRTTSFAGTKNKAGPLTRDLQTAGVLDAKHVPEIFKLSSVKQRLELLAGMIDTDGCVHQDTRRVCISNINYAMIEDFADVVRSLGWRATVASFPPVTSSSGIVGKHTVYQLTFSPDIAIPTVLKRKVIPKWHVLKRKRGIKVIRPCDPEPGRCIQVDREDGLYLVGKHLIPTHNSEQISRLFPAWFMGRNPWRNLMFGTYSQDFANEFGADVRAIMQCEQYRVVFPGVKLRRDSKAKDHMAIQGGGKLAFIGRGGAGTGKPADLFVIDDPIKDDAEAQSDATRNLVYQWFTKVAYTRCHTTSAIVIVHTRWHEDDLIGRLLDPDHPEHDPEIAKDWLYLNIPAVIKDDEMAKALGIELEMPTDEVVIREFCGTDEDGKNAPAFPLAPLWGNRFSLAHLASAHRLNPSGFNALYMGTPSAEEGDYFKRADIRYYDRDDLPKELRIYAASDHALSEKTHADPSVLGCVGVDEHDDIYVLPDLIWDKMPTDRAVEEMIAMMKRRKPLCWFAEADNIKKAIGPFLRKRMREESVYVPIFDMSTAKTDKKMRARSIQGRMQQGKVYLPRFAFWTPKAVQQLLKFDHGANDDFVDWIAWIGLGLDSEHAPSVSGKSKSKTPKRGTFGWLKWQTKMRDKRKKFGQLTGGW